MLFWLFVVLMVIGIVGYMLNNKYNWDFDIFDVFLPIVAVISMFIVMFMLVLIISEYNSSEGQKTELSEQYKALMYKIEMENIRDEFGITNKEYIDEIQEWNMKIAKYREYENNFWIGIFWSDIYGDFKPIDLNDIKLKNK